MVKEFFVQLKLKSKVKINAHGGKKMEPTNQDDASDHFLSAKRLHTRPTAGSNDRFLLLKPFILPNSDFGPIFLRERIPKEFQFLEEFLWNSKEFQKLF